MITPASRSAAISSGRGASANEATGTRSAMIRSTRSAASGGVGAQVHAERRVGPFLYLP